MTQVVDISKSDLTLMELISQTRDGNELLLTEEGRPLARLVPVPAEAPKQRIAGLHAGATQMCEDFDAPLQDSFWMGTIDEYRSIIKHILREYVAIPYAYDDVKRLTVFDDENGHYMIMLDGWEQKETRRVHGALVHLQIIDGKIWVQRDGTEYGIAQELVDAGIPKSQIVLGFQPSYMRPHTEFAVA